MSFTNSHNPKQYPGFQRWAAVRNRYTRNGAMRVFDNDFTTRYELNPSQTYPGWMAVSRSQLGGAPTMAPPEAALLAAGMAPSAFVTAQNCIEIVVVGSDGQVC